MADADNSSDNKNQKNQNIPKPQVLVVVAGNYSKATITVKGKNNTQFALFGGDFNNPFQKSLKKINGEYLVFKIEEYGILLIEDFNFGDIHNIQGCTWIGLKSDSFEAKFEIPQKQIVKKPLHVLPQDKIIASATNLFALSFMTFDQNEERDDKTVLIEVVSGKLATVNLDGDLNETNLSSFKVKTSKSKIVTIKLKLWQVFRAKIQISVIDGNEFQEKELIYGRQ